MNGIEAAVAPSGEQGGDGLLGFGLAAAAGGVVHGRLHVADHEDGAHAPFSSSAQRPFASTVTKGLCATSHRWPSGSAK